MFDDGGGDGGADVGVNVAKLIWGGWVSEIHLITRYLILMLLVGVKLCNC